MSLINAIAKHPTEETTLDFHENVLIIITTIELSYL